MKKMTIVSVALVTAIIVGAVFAVQQLQERQAVKDLQFSIDKIEVGGLNLTSVRVDITLRLTNPSKNAATLDRSDYTLLIENISMGGGSTSEKVRIPAGASRTISTSFVIPFSGAVQVAGAMINQKTLEYRLLGTAYVDTPVGAISMPFDVTGTMKSPVFSAVEMFDKLKNITA